MKVSVEKISKNESRFRTPLEEIDEMPFQPEVGKSLLLGSSTHESGGIITSLVEDWTFGDSTYTVKTKNSEYQIKVLEEQ